MPTATINPKNLNATASVLSRIAEKISDLTEPELAYLAGMADGLAYGEMPSQEDSENSAKQEDEH